MEAANRGALRAGVASIGLNIDLSQEQALNPYTTLSITFDHFFVRKVMFLKYAHGFIVFPGGFGTMDEFFESLVLIQTLKQAFFPVVLMGTDFWKGLIDWIKLTMLENNTYISPEDMDVFSLADDPKEAVRIIVDFKESNPRPGLDLPPGMKMVTNLGGP